MKCAYCSPYKDGERGNSWTFNTGYIVMQDWVYFQKKNTLTDGNVEDAWRCSESEETDHLEGSW